MEFTFRPAGPWLVRDTTRERDAEERREDPGRENEEGPRGVRTEYRLGRGQLKRNRLVQSPLAQHLLLILRLPALSPLQPACAISCSAMSVTPGKGRVSGIPTPGKSSIPTPGLPRPRSTSSATQRPSLVTQDDDYASRAFAEAIRANDPAQHRGPRANELAASQLSPSASTSFAQSGSFSLSASIRPSSSTSSYSSASAGRTPSAKAGPARPPSRTSDVFARSASRAGRVFDIGDNVRIESLGFEGILRYLGEIDGKPGMWAGVELSGGFAGKGKNNGSVAG